MIETKLQDSQGLAVEERHPSKSLSLNFFVSANINTRLLELSTVTHWHLLDS